MSPSAVVDDRGYNDYRLFPTWTDATDNLLFLTKEEKMNRRGTGIITLTAFITFGVMTGFLVPCDSFAEKFPVFNLTKPKIDKGQATRLLTNLHKGKLPPGLQSKDRPDAFL